MVSAKQLLIRRSSNKIADETARIFLDLNVKDIHFKSS